jgi:hypothetical protein
VLRIDSRLRQQYPDEPWMWRRDWAAGRVRAGDGPKAAMAWVGVVVVGAFSVPLLYKLP